MTLVVEFKSGKVVTHNEVDDFEQDDDYLYVYMRNGSLLRCRLRAVRYYAGRYETGQEFCIHPAKGRVY